jgi:hypothetical protein
MLVCDGSKRWRCHGRQSRAESQFGGIAPSLATRVIGPPSAPGNSMSTGSAPSSGVKCRHIMASCKIKRKAGRWQDYEMRI